MTEENNKQEFYLLDYFIVLAKYSRMIIYATLGAMILTFLILLILPNKYTTTTRLLPPQQNMTLISQVMDTLGGVMTPGGGGAGGSLGGMAAGLLGLKSPADLFADILNGNSIADKIIDRFDLKKVYDQTFIELARKELQKRSDISVDQKSGIISIEVTDEDPKRAAAMANAFVEELDKLLQEVSQQEARGRLTFLEKERSQATLNLSKAEDALKVFSEKSNVLQIDAQTRALMEYIAGLRAAIDAKEIQIKVMQQQAAAQNYDLIRLETELKSLKEKLRVSEEKEVNEIRQGDILIATSKVPTLGLEYLRLLREVKYQEALFQLFCKLTELARLDMVRDTAVVQVVDRALPPEKKSNRRGLPTILAGVVVFMLMIFVAFVREHVQEVKSNTANTQRLTTLALYLEPYHQLLLRLKNFICYWKRTQNQKWP